MTAEKELAQLRKIAAGKHNHPKGYDYDCLVCAAHKTLEQVDEEIRRGLGRYEAGLRAKEQGNG